MGPKRIEMMSKVWALVFLSLLLVEPSASLAIKEDSGASLKTSSSGSSGDDDDNKTDGGSGSMGKPQPMQIGAGVVLGLLVGGGGGSSSGAKGGGSGSSPSSKNDKKEEEEGKEPQSSEEDDGMGMFDGLFGSNDDEDEAPKAHKVAKKAAKKHAKKHH